MLKFDPLTPIPNVPCRPYPHVFMIPSFISMQPHLHPSLPKGVGVEVAKNTTLAGVHTLSLYDPTPTTIRDLGSNFYLTVSLIRTPHLLLLS